jgi:hypothetical protein
MDLAKKEQLKRILESAFSHAETQEISSPINLAELGGLIKFLNSDFSFREYGHDKLRPLLEEMSDVIELDRDDTYALPVYFASLKKHKPSPDIPAYARKNQLVMRSNETSAPLNFNDVRAPTSKLKELADKALVENWGDKDDLPLLRNYIQYTYIRLIKEGKVFLKGEAVAFNTGLVDGRYEPIYAFLQKNTTKGDPLAWFLSGFCCAAENFLGKQLVDLFNPLPDAAYYLESPSDAIYSVSQGGLHVDWEHVIEENADRIPSELLSLTAKGFEAKSSENMNKSDRDQYKKAFAKYLSEEKFAYRVLIDAFKRATDLAVKKVRWNYKTAVPIYYPAENTVSLLLPLCLLSNDRVDLALVVERQNSGNYQGHTIYTLDMAYINARLIARPESAWLKDI